MTAFESIRSKAVQNSIYQQSKRYSSQEAIDASAALEYAPLYPLSRLSEKPYTDAYDAADNNKGPPIPTEP
jgi:hypothetical protein